MGESEVTRLASQQSLELLGGVQQPGVCWGLRTQLSKPVGSSMYEKLLPVKLAVGLCSQM